MSVPPFNLVTNYIAIDFRCQPKIQLNYCFVSLKLSYLFFKLHRIIAANIYSAVLRKVDSGIV